MIFEKGTEVEVVYLNTTTGNPAVFIGSVLDHRFRENGELFYCISLDLYPIDYYWTPAKNVVETLRSQNKRKINKALGIK